MLDALLAQWSAVYDSIMNFSNSNSTSSNSSNNSNNSNSTSSRTLPTYSIDFGNSSSESAASAFNISGWTVTSMSGGNGTDAFAKHLQDILNRTVTRPILSDVIYHPIIAVIVLASTFALWRKIRSPTGTSALSWRDALGLALIGSCVAGKWMLEAIALTAAYVAWSSLIDRSWNKTGKLPDFDAFLASLHPAATPTATSNAATESALLTDDNPPTTASDSTTESSPTISSNPPSSSSETTTTTSPPTSLSPPAAAPSPESATLSRFEAQLGLPERKPEEECVVCWTSDESPLRLPCSHQVCSDCLTRLRDASRYTCPYCSTALFEPPNKTNRNLLYQLAVASSGAHLAICLTEAALKVAHRRYFGAAFMLLFNLPSAFFALRSQSTIRARGEEEFFAEVTEGSLGVQLGMSLYLAYSGYGRIPLVDWAAFRDGEWRRFHHDEWAVARGFMCWLAPGMAERVVNCSDNF